ncbi:MAG: hypothetical protein AB7V43_21805 [Acidimicrobiia bacterium]
MTTAGADDTVPNGTDAAPEALLVDVTIPLQPRYASTLRLVAASLAADAGFSVDDIDDIRLALDEAFTLLSDRYGDHRCRTVFDVMQGRLRATVQTEEGPSDVSPDEITLSILSAVVDRVSFEPNGITIEKLALT